MTVEAATWCSALDEAARERYRAECSPVRSCGGNIVLLWACWQVEELKVSLILIDRISYQASSAGVVIGLLGVQDQLAQAASSRHRYACEGCLMDEAD